MNQVFTNLCSRCGKQRVVVKTYKEKVGNSFVTYTQTACSDPDCQKIVESKNDEEELKRKRFKVEQTKKELERKQRTANSHKNKDKK